MEKYLQIDPNDTPFRNYYKVNDFHKIVKDMHDPVIFPKGKMRIWQSMILIHIN